MCGSEYRMFQPTVFIARYTYETAYVPKYSGLSILCVRPMSRLKRLNIAILNVSRRGMVTRLKRSCVYYLWYVSASCLVCGNRTNKLNLRTC